MDISPSLTTIHIYYTKNEIPFSDVTWRKYMNEMPRKFAERIEKFRRWEDRQNALTGRLLLKRALLTLNPAFDVLKEDYHGKNILEEIKLSEFGKPYFAPSTQKSATPIHFNISHSGTYVVCAVHSKRLGVDIQRARPIKFDDFKKVLTSDEKDFICNSHDQLKAFYTIWTKKECVIKGDGRGLSAGLGSFCVAASSTTLNGRTWYMTPLLIDCDYASHISTLMCDPHIALHRMKF